MPGHPELARVLDEILRPLLSADGGGIEVISWDGAELVVALTGAFRGDPGTPYVQSVIVLPALRKVLGPNVRIVWSSAPVGPPPG